MSRRDEVHNVRDGQEPEWLAGQMDDIEKAFIGRMDNVTAELAALRKILMGILISIVIALISVPVGIIWATAVHR